MSKVKEFLLKHNVDVSEFTPKALITVIGVFMVGLGILGISNNMLSQFTLPLADAFSVDRSVISLCSTFAKIAGTIASIMFGLTYRKLSVKGIIAAAGFTCMIQYIMIALAQGPWWVYIGCFIGGFGSTFGGGLLILTIIEPWFPTNVGIFAAICGMSTGFGGQIFVPIIALPIVEKGFRHGAWITAFCIAAATAVAVLLSFQSPNDPLRKLSKEEVAKMKADKKAAEEEKKAAALAAGTPVLGYLDLLKLPIVWVFMLLMFVASGTNQPFVSAWNGIADWRGYQDAALVGAAAVASYNGLLVWAKFIMGFLKDRGFIKTAIILAWGTNIISVIGVMFFSPTPAAFKFFCTLNAFAGTSTGILLALCMMHVMGKYCNAAALGLMTAVFNIGRAIGAPLIHLPYDLTGSYDITMWVVLIVGIFMLVLLLASVALGKNTIASLDKRFGVVKAEEAEAKA